MLASVAELGLFLLNCSADGPSAPSSREHAHRGERAGGRVRAWRMAALSRA